jgi:hypothetical protein
MKDIVCLAKTPNRGLGHLWSKALAAAGIECTVKEHFAFWNNKVPCLQADLWVERDKLERASDVLAHNSPETPLPANPNRQKTIH